MKTYYPIINLILKPILKPEDRYEDAATRLGRATLFSACDADFSARFSISWRNSSRNGAGSRIEMRGFH